MFISSVLVYQDHSGFMNYTKSARPEAAKRLEGSLRAAHCGDFVLFCLKICAQEPFETILRVSDPSDPSGRAEFVFLPYESQALGRERRDVFNRYYRLFHSHPASPAPIIIFVMIVDRQLIQDPTRHNKQRRQRKQPNCWVYPVDRYEHQIQKYRDG